MFDVTVILRNNSVQLNFQVEDFKYSTDDDGNFVGYEISTAGTYTAIVYIDPKEVVGIVVTGDQLIEAKEPVAD